MTGLVLPAGAAAQDFVGHVLDDNAHGTASIYACDLDGDLDNDVIGAVEEENAIVMWRNDGGDPVTWTRQTIGSGFSHAQSVYAEDVDGDKDYDVLGASGGGVIAVWFNDGGDPIQWTKQTVRSGYYDAHEVYAYDLDGDEDTDILGVSSQLGLVSWWRNDGGDPIVWTEQTIRTAATEAKSVRVEDFDGDGNMDVVAAILLLDQISWFRNDGGDPIDWTEFAVDRHFTGAHRVQAVDIDGDSIPDILGAAYLGDEVSWWRNNGGDPVTWTKQVIGTHFSRACVAYAADLDGDTDLDVMATAQGGNQVAWWRNDGGSPIKWTKSVIDGDFIRVWPLHACDLDGDLDNDIVAGSSFNGINEIRWWENRIPPTGIGNESPDLPAGTFDLSQNYPNPFNPHTTIRFALTHPSRLELSIYDVKGRLVRSLSSGRTWDAGTHVLLWDGRDNSGIPVGSGVYLYRIVTDSASETRKMTLLR